MIKDKENEYKEFLTDTEYKFIQIALLEEEYNKLRIQLSDKIDEISEYLETLERSSNTWDLINITKNTYIDIDNMVTDLCEKNA